MDQGKATHLDIQTSKFALIDSHILSRGPDNPPPQMTLTYLGQLRCDYVQVGNP